LIWIQSPAAAGVAVPEGLQLDGRNILPLLEGKDVDWPDRTIVIQSHRGDKALRYQHMMVRDQQWKLLRSTGFGRETPVENVPFELYDMSADPQEQNNLAEKEPEIFARLKQAYDTWFDDVSGTRPGNYAPPRIVVGTDHETTTVLTWQDWRVVDPAGWGRQGEWFLRFEGDHAYDVQLKWPKPIPAATAELQVGSVTKTLDIGDATSTAVFQNVQIPAGDAELMVTITRDGKKSGPYHVVLVRK